VLKLGQETNDLRKRLHHVPVGWLKKICRYVYESPLSKRAYFTYYLLKTTMTERQQWAFFKDKEAQVVREVSDSWEDLREAFGVKDDSAAAKLFNKRVQPLLDNPVTGLFNSRVAVEQTTLDCDRIFNTVLKCSCTRLTDTDNPPIRGCHADTPNRCHICRKTGVDAWRCSMCCVCIDLPGTE
jgi:Uri superfamily endonuclease